VCPFHGDCLEGLASGTAIVARYGVSLDRLPPDHDANQVIGQYLGQLTANLILTLSAERVIFGGGVMKNEGLFPRIRLAALEILNGYPSGIGEAGSLERVVVAPGLGERSGLLGALRLAQTQAFAD
jgi:fructokinase